MPMSTVHAVPLTANRATTDLDITDVIPSPGFVSVIPDGPESTVRKVGEELY